jgi:hypothetical protein
MRSIATLAAALGGALLSTGAMAAADNTLGVAHLSAVVQATGQVIRGSGVVSAELFDTDTYEVEFERNVRDCTYVANAGSVGTGLFSALRIPVVESSSSKQDAVNVRIFNKDGVVSLSSFHLMVFCAQ